MALVYQYAVLIMGCLVLAACQSAPVTSAGAPVACRAFDRAATLPLPPTSTPATAPADKAGPLRFAHRVPVNGGVGDIGQWESAGRGWQAWRLRLISENAKSLSVRLQPISLPSAAELWLCSPGGALRHGPYRAEGFVAPFFSPQVPGPELWLEVLAPASKVPQVELKIADVFAGYR